MRVLALWDIDSSLRNALLEHLAVFNRMYPGAGLQFELFIQETPLVRLDDVLREPEAPIAALAERQTAPADGGPARTPLERAMAAVSVDPNRSARAIAKEIGVGHQTVLRAKETLKPKSGE
jgi:hypothetical protein